MKRGFSLMEIMISICILAFIGTLLGGTLVRQLDAKERLEAFTERENTARMTLTRMARELSMAYLSKHYNCIERRTITLFKGRSGPGDGLTFTSFSHYKWAKDVNESDQNEITYTIKSDPDGQGHQALFRREAPRIADDPGKLGKEYVLAHNISSIDYEFYNPDSDVWEKEWDTTRPDYKFKLPLYVKIQLKLPMADGKPKVFETKTKIMLQDPLGFGPNLCLQ